MFQELFGTPKALIGVVHLLPLPGSPLWRGNMNSVVTRALADAQALEDGGAHGLIVENFGDAPFSTGSVKAHTVAAMALLVKAVIDQSGLPVGINVLRNDPISALAIGVVTGARFVRANVHYGVMAADEGLIQGRADKTLRYRRNLIGDEGIKIFADVLVKHAVPIGITDIGHVAEETVHRGLADAIIVTGTATGAPALQQDVAIVKNAVQDAPVLVGSGVDEHNAEAFLALADGAIVGTSLKVDGVVHNPVDLNRVKRLARRFKEVSSAVDPGASYS